MSRDKFPPGVAKELGAYVYRLIDPRNGETFYVGKGRNNRVFEHINAKIKTDDPGDKLKRIRDIRTKGFDVAHIIHRHGMDDKTAFEVEAALIDAYPGLTNAVSGGGSNAFGSMHADEIVSRYEAVVAKIEHRAILINVNHTLAETSPYEATRYSWKINPSRADRAEIVLAVCRGMIVAVFIAEEWLPATSENFPGRESQADRYGFLGREAPDDLLKAYVGKCIPGKYRKKGAANPIKYTYR